MIKPMGVCSIEEEVVKCWACGTVASFQEEDVRVFQIFMDPPYEGEWHYHYIFCPQCATEIRVA